MKKYFCIKIEIYIFTNKGKKEIIDEKILDNSLNGFYGFFNKYFDENNRIF
jgi:hypothetical protein